MPPPAALESDIRELQANEPSISKITFNPRDTTFVSYQIDIYFQPIRKGKYHVRFLVSEEYPYDWPPWIGFCTTMFHPHLDSAGLIEEKMLHHLYSHMGETFSLQMIFHGICSFLENPIHPCENCNRQYEEMAEQQIAHESNISQYQSLQKHRDLFQQWQSDWFMPPFLACLEYIRSTNDPKINHMIQKGWLKEESQGVYSLLLFTPAFCTMLIEEYEQYQTTGLPIRRPNSMNRYGLVLNTIGWEEMVLKLQSDYFQPLIRTLFPKEGSELDQHHTFLIQYKGEKDVGLDMHSDDSDVTVNVCLGKEFEGSLLSFCGHMGTGDHRQLRTQYHHAIGRAVIHVGQQRHGAGNITSGERINLIIWNRNFAWRSSKASRSGYVAEIEPPTPICVSYTHDRDYEVYHQAKPDKVDTFKRRWCPPSGLEYPQFHEAMKKIKQ